VPAASDLRPKVYLEGLLLALFHEASWRSGEPLRHPKSGALPSLRSAWTGGTPVPTRTPSFTIEDSLSIGKHNHAPLVATVYSYSSPGSG